MSNLKKYIDVAKESAGVQHSDEDQHENNRPTLRDQMISYLSGAQKAIEAWPAWPAWPGH